MTPMRDRVSTLLWLTGSVLLLAFPLRTWIGESAHGPLTWPVTPFDRSDPNAARQWLFLSRAAAIVPPGATYTVVATDRDVEMNLFMISIGLLPDAHPLPTSYYGIPFPAVGSRARFVISYENARAPGPMRIRAAFAEGYVAERPSG